MSDIEYYYDLAYDSPAESEESSETLSIEDWQDWNSEELLNLWMSIVQYHEEWYLPLRKTFNDFCEFVYNGQVLGLGPGLLTSSSDTQLDEVQAIKDHPFIKGLDWELFFFSTH